MRLFLTSFQLKVKRNIIENCKAVFFLMGGINLVLRRVRRNSAERSEAKQTTEFHNSDSANLLRKYPGYSKPASSLEQMPPISEHHESRRVIGKRGKGPCGDSIAHSASTLQCAKHHHLHDLICPT